MRRDSCFVSGGIPARLHLIESFGGVAIIAVLIGLLLPAV